MLFPLEQLHFTVSGREDQILGEERAKRDALRATVPAIPKWKKSSQQLLTFIHRSIW